MHPIAPSGQPALSAALAIILAVSIIHFFALGCGDKTIAFLAFIEIIAL